MPSLRKILPISNTRSRPVAVFSVPRGQSISSLAAALVTRSHAAAEDVRLARSDRNVALPPTTILLRWSSVAIRRVSSLSRALWWVRKGLASAPPAVASRTGVSTCQSERGQTPTAREGQPSAWPLLLQDSVCSQQKRSSHLQEPPVLQETPDRRRDLRTPAECVRDSRRHNHVHIPLAVPFLHVGEPCKAHSPLCVICTPATPLLFHHASRTLLAPPALPPFFPNAAGLPLLP